MTALDASPGGRYSLLGGDPSAGPLGPRCLRCDRRVITITAHSEQLRLARVPWTVRDVWLGVLGVAVILGTVWALTYELRGFWLKPDLDLWVPLFPTLAKLLFLVPVWWIAMRKYHASLRTLGFAEYSYAWIAIGLVFLCLFYMFLIVYTYLLHLIRVETLNTTFPLLRHLPSPWPLFATAVVVAPVAEEVFFRGFVFAGLRSRYHWRVAALISATLFAAGHFDLASFVPVFVMGLVFAFLYQRSKSLWPGVMVHMCLSALALVVPYVVS